MIGHSFIPANQVHQRFLRMLDAPEMTTELSFTVAVGGLLRCKAEYLTDVKGETAVKEWEVRLPRTNPLYQLITDGEVKQ